MARSPLFRVKNINTLLLDAAAEGHGALKRTLGSGALVALGIGAIIGAGLFVRTAAASAEHAGPAVTISYIIAAIGCAFAGLCYAEFASMIPIAGSAYTYSYATMGELVAWIIGWDLVLEYALGAATVAIAWSEYLNKLLEDTINWSFPYAWCHSPFEVSSTGEHGLVNLPALFILILITAILIRGTKESAFVNGIIVIVKVTIVLIFIALGWGFMNSQNHEPYIPQAGKYAEAFIEPQDTTEPVHFQIHISGVTRAEAGQKQATFVSFTADSIAQIRRDLSSVGGDSVATAAALAAAINDFHPPQGPDFTATATGSRVDISCNLMGTKYAKGIKVILSGDKGIDFKVVYVKKDIIKKEWKEDTATNNGFGGWMGILAGAGVVFFAFIGFDAVSTAAQEAKDPKRGMPIGILVSLAVCTILYIIFSHTITGVAHYEEFRIAGKEASVAYAIDTYMGYTWLSTSITVAILAGFSSVILVMLLGQSRVFFSMSRDGLVPKVFSDVHPRRHTPYKSNLIFLVFVGLFAAFVPGSVAGDMTSIGTLFAFVLVSAGVWIMRITNPEIERPFRVPLVPVISILGVFVCGAMIFGLGWENWMRLGIWMAIGFLIYFLYGIKKSKLNKGDQ